MTGSLGRNAPPRIYCRHMDRERGNRIAPSEHGHPGHAPARTLTMSVT